MCLLASDATIDTSYIRSQIDDMNRRKKYLNNHKYAITQNKDGKWYTYLPDPVKGRKLYKRSSRKELEDIIVECYEKLESLGSTFEEVYFMWREYKDKMVSDNTAVRYDTDYARCLEGTDFVKMPVSVITEDDISVFIKQRIESLKLPKKAAKMLFGYIHNTLLFACRHKLIDEDVMRFMKPGEFYEYCVASKRSQKSQTISDEDNAKLQALLRDDIQNNPTYIPPYAVVLSSLTGMRVGELAALTWDCVFEDRLLINKSEKYNRKTKTYSIEGTKNGKSRVFPMTKEIKELLYNLKKIEIANGFLTEYVFSGESGRIHTNVICSCIKNKCRTLGITERGIHAYRKTLNSKMRCSGVSATVAASLLGHSPEVNEQYYTYDVADFSTKTSIISELNKKVMGE